MIPSKISPKNFKKFYLDVQATTPIDPRVMDAMMPYYTSIFGNSHSRTHSYGWNAENGVEIARKQLADLIKSEAKDIIFTSGATESNNLALKGLIEFKVREKMNSDESSSVSLKMLETILSDKKPISSEGSKNGKEYLAKDALPNKKPSAWRPHIITTQIEHKCILDTCRYLEEIGCEVTYLNVNKDGVINVSDLEKSIKKNTVIISIMAVNNEIGSIQPLNEIGKIARKNNITFHCDGAQAVGKIKIDVDEMNIDMLSISGHKMYAPKGIGALYVRRKPRVRICPQINGGGQERGLRSGTIPVPLVVGLGKAAEICKKEMERDMKYIGKISRNLYTYLKEKLKDITKNGKGGYPGCLNISFPYVEGESLLMKMKDVALSSGSACTSSSLEPSYVIRALGTSEDLAHSSIRFGIGRFTMPSEVKKIGINVVKNVKELRNLSPLHEMVKEGINLESIKWSKD